MEETPDPITHGTTTAETQVPEYFRAPLKNSSPPKIDVPPVVDTVDVVDINEVSPAERLKYFQPLIEAALTKCEQVVQEMKEAHERGETFDGGKIFDARSELYELAMKMCGYEARKSDLLAMHDLIRPQRGEVSVDLSAGTGFLTQAVEYWTGARTYAVDPSEIQLQHLVQNCGDQVTAVHAAPNETDKIFADGNIPHEGVDVVTSFGGWHHVDKEKLPEAMQNVADMLKPKGRFVVGDVGAETPLQRHFDEIVTDKCLTGHEMGQFMSPEKLKELAESAGLELVSAEMKPLTWDFNSEEEMAWFFKGLHAYPQPVEEIIQDLRDTLGVKEEDGKFKLNWPMLFWEIRKPE
ncbi:hypothetical protein A3A71_00785 [Candidatus Berkelbacteria bacterium RIFCSPLOWO2_01_FULL_50_28]|uniref:Methyltransferase domain-containing protein n=1 Tax=Candidatus Berkelbacteria bacterium RIFCSPLOWO2_01_FULL_50_28 TaxID=1797471 RepID=A0A1F5EAY4_9BACT|nr:MAG: hypothetical protein A2807_01355 [Candidatus Berkelbacteria bacterium RIFCSPHIGHO2_01_FULL_50_36]OGD64577.1 MAG: hypothetical protein A3A71_00785 [Candidatus Berkelbacteria bacterium RIFCSPLOWO2_01_FULL_50_28]